MQLAGRARSVSQTFQSVCPTLEVPRGMRTRLALASNNSDLQRFVGTGAVFVPFFFTSWFPLAGGQIPPPIRFLFSNEGWGAFARVCARGRGRMEEAIQTRVPWFLKSLGFGRISFGDSALKVEQPLRQKAQEISEMFFVFFRKDAQLRAPPQNLKDVLQRESC